MGLQQLIAFYIESGDYEKQRKGRRVLEEFWQETYDKYQHSSAYEGVKLLKWRYKKINLGDTFDTGSSEDWN
eukprot:CAMPEP_0170174084 /NCGR_PEP_ID=MMETSP0040_2-20121228/7339_1 /TAXON_ID=641309 /ORGANISM="Lotharella oceanica, Strain CCMP622" /LENGTH=71 /DNA_ID=CAMNT_0010415573 /DNA_START=222 /DNA_END=437 /DNA_ORIENTATION=+